MLDYNTVYGWYNLGSHGTNTVFADPLFVSEMDHNLQSGSPSIDAGTNNGAPGDDIAGKARPIDGDGNGTATVDIGAFEAGATTINNFLPLLLR